MRAAVAGPSGFQLVARLPCNEGSPARQDFGLAHDGPYVVSREFSGTVSDWYVVIIEMRRLPRS